MNPHSTQIISIALSKSYAQFRNQPRHLCQSKLKNCVETLVQMIYDVMLYLLQFPCFTLEIILIIYWDIDALGSVALHTVYVHNDHPASQ
jgi:hypothetical protein